MADWSCSVDQAGIELGKWTDVAEAAVTVEIRDESGTNALMQWSVGTRSVYVLYTADRRLDHSICRCLVTMPEEYRADLVTSNRAAGLPSV